MKFYYTYILQSKKDGNFYTGSTNDLKRRFKEHNSGKVQITKYRRPFELIYYEASRNEKDARKREKYLKTAWGKRYIKNRLKNYLAGLTIAVLALIALFSPQKAFAGELQHQFTAELWVKPETTASKALLVKNNEIRLYTNGSGNPACQIHNGSDWQTAAVSSSALSANQWQHIACTYDKSTLKVHLDGVLVGSTSLSVTVNDATTNFRAGSDEGGTYGDLNGTIDDLRIYNYARSSKQIVEDMNAGHPIGGSPVGSQVGYWKFDEGYGTTAHDSSPHGNDGTLTGTTVPEWTNAGKFGKALNLDGDDDEVYIPADSSFIDNCENEMTFTAWVKLDELPSEEGDTECIAGFTGASIDRNWQLYGYSSNDKFYFRITNGTSSDSISVDIPTDGEWHYVGGRYKKGSDLSIMLDGKVYSKTPTIDLVMKSKNLEIGAFGGNNYDWLDGSIDEVKIYNSALTEDEIKLDYNRGKSTVMGALSTESDGTTSSNSSSRGYCIPGDTTACSPPIAEWKFDEKTGTDANDTSGNGNTGTLTNMESTDWKSSAQCHEGGCLEFDGSNESVEINQSLGFAGDQPYTLSAWYKGTDTSGAILSINYNADPHKGVDMWSNGSGEVATHIISSWSGDAIKVTSNSGGSGFISITDDNWHHISITYDGSMNASGVKIYVDNQKQPTSISTDTLTSTDVTDDTNPIRIAGRSNGSGNITTPVSGKIDHVKIYDYARTPAQIAWDYNRGKPVGHWRLDECEGTTAYDVSGNGNNGSINIGSTGTQTSVGTCDTSGAWYNGSNGKINASLNFDGTDDNVTITNFSYGGDVYEISFSFWMRNDGNFGEYRRPINNADNIFGGGDDDTGFDVIVSTNDMLGIGINGENSINGVELSNIFTLEQGTFYHVVGTWDGSTLKAYINGKLEDSTSGSTDGKLNRNLITIGSRNGNSQNWLGLVDDVRIYNYALTEQQVKNLYNQGGAVRFTETE